MNYLLSLDERIFLVLNGILGQSTTLDWLIKTAAVYLIYLVPVILIIVWFWSAYSKKPALQAFFAGVLAWGINKIISNIIDRPRPYEAALDIKEAIFHRPDYSFPSDHMALLASIALAFYLVGYKKLAVFWWILTAVIGISRIIAGVHYPSDIIAGAVLGTIVTWLFGFAFQPLSAHIFEPLIKVLKRTK